MGNAKGIDVVMPMFNLIEYSHNYLKTSGSLWQYCRDELALDDNGNIVGQTGQTSNSSTKNVEIMVPLRYLSNF